MFMMQNDAKTKRFLLPVAFNPYHLKRHRKVEAGNINEEAKQAYLGGQCFALALQYLQSMSDDEIKKHRIKFLFQVDKERKNFDFVHAYVYELNTDNIIDINGIHSEFDYISKWQKRYMNYATFETQMLTLERALQYQTDSEIVEWLNGSPKQRLDAAKTFVAPLKSIVNIQKRLL